MLRGTVEEESPFHYGAQPVYRLIECIQESVARIVAIENLMELAAPVETSPPLA